eukprot:GFUD01019109.1.p1 GENE.GFUD01019109.1~~GFUD01019109.1.p1  ORF type:complete len:137 (-),score=27.31 GFUD01019109.1:28-438(-)
MMTPLLFKLRVRLLTNGKQMTVCCYSSSVNLLVLHFLSLATLTCHSPTPWLFLQTWVTLLLTPHEAMLLPLVNFLLLLGQPQVEAPPDQASQTAHSCQHVVSSPRCSSHSAQLQAVLFTALYMCGGAARKYHQRLT